MSRNFPNDINPEGTRYRRVRLTGSSDTYPILPSIMSKQGVGAMRVIGAYIKADYAVSVETYYERGIQYMDAVCEPPLFEGIL
jgi:hypothetical protein